VNASLLRTDVSSAPTRERVAPFLSGLSETQGRYRIGANVP